MDNVAYVNISSYSGISIGATHYYGKLEYNDQFEELNYEMTKDQAQKFCAKDPSDLFTYREGETTTRFDTRDSVIAVALGRIKEYPDIEILLEGGKQSASVQEVVWAKDKVVMDKINKLYEEADALDYYSGKDDARMEDIDDTFSAIMEINFGIN